MGLSESSFGKPVVWNRLTHMVLPTFTMPPFFFCGFVTVEPHSKWLLALAYPCDGLSKAGLRVPVYNCKETLLLYFQVGECHLCDFQLPLCLKSTSKGCCFLCSVSPIFLLLKEAALNAVNISFSKLPRWASLNLCINLLPHLFCQRWKPGHLNPF